MKILNNAWVFICFIVMSALIALLSIPLLFLGLILWVVLDFNLLTVGSDWVMDGLAEIHERY